MRTPGGCCQRRLEHFSQFLGADVGDEALLHRNGERCAALVRQNRPETTVARGRPEKSPQFEGFVVLAHSLHCAEQHSDAAVNGDGAMVATPCAETSASLDLSRPRQVFPENTHMDKKSFLQAGHTPTLLDRPH
jgi:hypothetical protein